jgi:hypothetical protein
MNCIWTAGDRFLSSSFPELAVAETTPPEAAPNARAAVDRTKPLRENDEVLGFIIH